MNFNLKQHKHAAIVLADIINATDPSRTVFDVVPRTHIAYQFTSATGEVYGAGMPDFNAAVRLLVDLGAVKRTTRGRNTYYKPLMTVSQLAGQLISE